jgi:hypothetical protein
MKLGRTWFSLLLFYKAIHGEEIQNEWVDMSERNSGYMWQFPEQDSVSTSPYSWSLWPQTMLLYKIHSEGNSVWAQTQTSLQEQTGPAGGAQLTASTTLLQMAGADRQTRELYFLKLLFLPSHLLTDTTMQSDSGDLLCILFVIVVVELSHVLPMHLLYHFSHITRLFLFR